MPTYKNIPGVDITLLDGQLSTSTQVSGTRLLIIGDVPTGVSTPDEPVLVRTVADLRAGFGDFSVNGVDNQLAIEWQAAMDESKANVYLLALKGATPKQKFLNLYNQLNGYMIDLQFDHVVLTGLYADELTDKLTVTDFTQPDDKTDFPSLPGIVAIEKEVSEGKTTTEYVGSPGHLIASYAERQSLSSNETIGYIGVKPPTAFGTRDIATYVSALVEQKNEFSKFLQVIVGPQHGVMVETSLKAKWALGPAVYAAQVSQLPITTAPTNQKIKSVSTLRWMFSQRQIDSLIGNKYVVFTIKNGNVIVVDAVTTSPDIKIGEETKKSDYSRLSTLRAINSLVKEIRELGESYIGITTGFPTYSSLKAGIKSVIDNSINIGAISDATFALTVGEQFDSIVIKLTVQPTFELRNIAVTIGLSDPTNFTSE
ncbi:MULTISPECIES: hypothetical protein [Enterococcus]|uniref:hypothetical protein n=1 Tax=Enterococcus TaxID=1350 RepID=UPI000A39C71E|nr:hypothetical protein [Enterococcus sp. 4E1_DIV0656]OTO09106.1 hypothetical protein A5882_003436 [Enterococcus sp. 4E1_DIV0656]